MMRTLFAIALLSAVLGCSREGPAPEAGRTPAPAAGQPHETPEEKPVAQPNPVVIMDTSEGVIGVELDAAKAPLTVKNFLQYVDEGFYDGTVFHRVIPNFMIQGGGFTADMTQKPTHAPVRNEANNELRNRRGTIAMARTSDVHSATAQFFINHVDNAFLDHRDTTARGYGYCVFGRVIDGLEVVDKIAAVKTGTKAGMENVPLATVTIRSIRRPKAAP